MSGLRGAKTNELTALRAAVDAGEINAPLTRASLIGAGGFASVIPFADVVAGLDAKSAVRLLDLVLEERAAQPVPPRLVWSGPEVVGGRAIGTADALRELCARATRSVLLAGYAFDHGERILAPFHQAAKRGANVEMYLHVDEAPEKESPKEFADRELLRFFAKHWTWPERPVVYYDPRTASGNDGKHASMHAKCIVVDDRWALVGSANFTDRAHTRNVEVGALVDDQIFAVELVRQFHTARDLGLFTKYGD